jgi:hypothetical protein
MKLTTPGSGDSPQDLSRAAYLSRARENDTRARFWHRAGTGARNLGTAGPAPAVGTDGVNGLTRHDGRGTTHGRGEPAPDATGGPLPIWLARTTMTGQGP